MILHSVYNVLGGYTNIWSSTAPSLVMFSEYVEFGKFVISKKGASSELIECAKRLVWHCENYGKWCIDGNSKYMVRSYYISTLELFVKEFGKAALSLYSITTGNSLPDIEEVLI